MARLAQGLTLKRQAPPPSPMNPTPRPPPKTPVHLWLESLDRSLHAALNRLFQASPLGLVAGLVSHSALAHPNMLAVGCFSSWLLDCCFLLKLCPPRTPLSHSLFAAPLATRWK